MSSTSPLVVNGPAARVLLEPETLELLRPFMQGALSVSEASERLGLPLSKLYYRVKRLCALGLLQEVAVVPRKGRAMKRYRAAAERFFVPFRASGASDLKAFLRDFEAQWAEPLLEVRVRSLLESGLSLEHFGVGFHLNEAGLFMFTLASGPDAPDLELDNAPFIASVWDTSFYLSPEDVAALSEEVSAVLEHYRDKRSGPRYALHFACAPWQPTRQD